MTANEITPQSTCRCIICPDNFNLEKMSELLYHGVFLGEPKAQMRHKHAKLGKTDFITVYDPSAKEKRNFLSVLQSEAPKEPWDFPIMMEINFYMSRPKGHYGTGKNKAVLKPLAPEWHSGRPDLDNLTKFIQDALNKVFYSDDSRIAQLVCRKLYSEKPRTEIFISSLL